MDIVWDYLFHIQHHDPAKSIVIGDMNLAATAFALVTSAAAVMRLLISPLVGSVGYWLALWYGSLVEDQPARDVGSTRHDIAVHRP